MIRGPLSAYVSGLWPPLLFALAISLLSTRAHALEATLRVEPGATCVQADSLRVQINAWLGQTSRGAGMTIDVQGSDSDPRVIGFVLREGTRAIASRRFEPGPSACAQLEASLALSIALALKASLLDELEPARPSWRFALGISGLALLSFAPRAPLGAQPTLDVALAQRAWMRAGLAFWASGNNELRQGLARFELRALAFRGELCGAPLAQRAWSLVTCAGTRIGGLWARGSERTRDPWVALSAGAGASLNVTERWSVEIFAALLASLARSRFELRSTDGARVDAYTLPTLASELTVGPRLLF